MDIHEGQVELIIRSELPDKDNRSDYFFKVGTIMPSYYYNKYNYIILTGQFCTRMLCHFLTILFCYKIHQK